jgi:hypothetical protein
LAIAFIVPLRDRLKKLTGRAIQRHNDVRNVGPTRGKSENRITRETLARKTRCRGAVRMTTAP